MTDPLNWNGDSEKKLIKYGAIPPESCSNLLDNGLSCIQNDAFNASRINMIAPWLFRQKAINTSNVDSITAVTTGTIKTVPFITTTYRSMQIPSWSSCTRTQPGGLHMPHSRFGHQRHLRMARLRNSSLPSNHGRSTYSNTMSFKLIHIYCAWKFSPNFLLAAIGQRNTESREHSGGVSVRLMAIAWAMVWAQREAGVWIHIVRNVQAYFRSYDS